MAALTDAHRLFIIEQFACYSSLDEIESALDKVFGVKVPKPTILRYDPTTIQGEKELAQKWKDLFQERRQRFLENVSEIPIANKAVRLRRLDDLSRDPMVRKNPVQLRATLEQAAKEAADFYLPRPAGKPGDAGEEGGPSPDADTEAAERSTRVDALVDAARARRNREDTSQRAEVPNPASGAPG